MVSTLASETQPVLATPSMMVHAPPPPQGFFRIIKYQEGGGGPKPPPSLPQTPPSPPLPILQKFSFVVRDSAYLLGVPPSLWGTKSAVYPPLLALDSSHR